MGKRIKRIISWLVVISLVSALLPPAAAAQTGPQPAPVAESVTKTVPAETRPQPTAETEPQPQPTAGTEPQPQPTAGTESQPQPTAETGTQPQTAPEMGTQPQPTPELEAVNQPAPEPESAGQATPESVGQATPVTVGQTTPEGAGQATPVTVDQTTPEGVDQTTPEGDDQTTLEGDDQTTPEAGTEGTVGTEPALVPGDSAAVPEMAAANGAPTRSGVESYNMTITKVDGTVSNHISPGCSFTVDNITPSEGYTVSIVSASLRPSREEDEEHLSDDSWWRASGSVFYDSYLTREGSEFKYSHLKGDLLTVGTQYSLRLEVILRDEATTMSTSRYFLHTVSSEVAPASYLPSNINWQQVSNGVKITWTSPTGADTAHFAYRFTLYNQAGENISNSVIISNSTELYAMGDVTEKQFYLDPTIGPVTVTMETGYFYKDDSLPTADDWDPFYLHSNTILGKTTLENLTPGADTDPPTVVKITRDFNSSVDLSSSPVTVTASAVDIGTLQEAAFWLQEQTGENQWQDVEGTRTVTPIPSPTFNAKPSSGWALSALMDLSGLTVGKTYRLQVQAKDAAGNISDIVSGEAFVLTGTISYPPLGITAVPSVNDFTLTLTLSDTAREKIRADLLRYNYTVTEEQLTAFLQSPDNTWRVTVNDNTMYPYTLQGSAGADGALTLRVPLKWYSTNNGTTQSALNSNGISAGKICTFQVQIYSRDRAYSWASSVNAKYLTTLNCTGGKLLEDIVDPQIDGTILVDGADEGTFNSTTDTFSVRASDNYLLAEYAQFYWRVEGDEAWNSSANTYSTTAPYEGAPYDSAATYSMKLTSLFPNNGGDLVNGTRYEIKAVVSDVGGRTAEVIKTLTYTQAPAPEFEVESLPGKSALKITWQAVEDTGADYLLYLDGTAYARFQTSSSDVEAVEGREGWYTKTLYLPPAGAPAWEGEEGETYPADFTAALATEYSSGISSAVSAEQPVTLFPDTTPPEVVFYTSSSSNVWVTTPQAGTFQVNGSVEDENWEKYARVEVVKRGQSDDDVLLFTYDARSAGKIENTPWDFTTLAPYCYYYGDKGYLTSAFNFQFWLNTLDVENPGYGAYDVIIPAELKADADALAEYFTAVTDEETGATTYTLRDGTYAFRITVGDYAGNRGVSYHPFTVNNVAPALPEGFTHSAQVRMNYPGYSQCTITWSGAEEYPVRLWLSSYGYDTVEEREAAIEKFLENGTGVGTPQNFLPGGATSYSGTYSGSLDYYFYAVAVCNAAGVAGEVLIGRFDTCFQDAALTVEKVTYTPQGGEETDITESGGSNLEQGGTLSVTASGDFFTPNGTGSVSAYLWHGDTRLNSYTRFDNSDENGKRTVTITYTIPTNNFSWSGPQQVYAKISDSYYNIRTPDIPVGLKAIPDEEKPTLTNVSPAPGAGISGNAEFTLTAKDNSGYVTQAKVEQSPYTGTESWTEIEGTTWDGSVLTLDTTKLTADATGNIKLRFAVADAAGNWSDYSGGSYALANSPIPAPTGLNVTAGERQITLNWNPVQRVDTAGYYIYRAVDSGAYVQVGTASKGQNTFTDTDNGGYLDPTRAYSYQVAAYSDANMEGEKSVATGWLHPLEQTNAPTILSLEPWQGSAFRSPVTVTAKVEDEIRVKEVKLEFAWLGTSSTAEPDSSTVWQTIQTVNDPSPDAEGGRTYTITAQWTLDEAAQTEQWYALRVTASNNSNKTAVSTVKCRYDNQAPDKVSDLTATDEGSGGAILLTFTASPSPDVQKYVVYRADSSSFEAARSIGETAAGAFRDSTCEKGNTYFYWITAVDRAGNESQATGPVSATAGAVCDVAIVQPPVSRDSVLTVGRAATIAVSVRNAGPARAGGTLTLTADYGGGAVEAGGVTFGESGDYALLRAGETREVLFTLTPVEGEKVTLSAAFASDGDATDTNPDNNTLATEALSLNHAPAAVWSLEDNALTCDSGETIALTAEGSTDADGDALTYIWDIGGESKTGMAVSHRFMTPGSYPVTLTATDEKGAATVLTGTVTVADNRPDLYVDSIAVERRGGEDEDYSAVTGDNPIQEGDAVKVTATIGNQGPGPVPADMSFLTSLIRNGTSLGYQTLTGLEKDETKTVTFHYTAAAGAQVLKVVTNDILQVISEPDMTNNVLTVQYNADQVEFADIAVTNLNWQNLNNPDNPAAFTTQDQVIWSAAVENKGEADATFTLTLYVDGQVAAQRQVFRAVGATGVESFAIAPTAGVHTVTLTAGGELLDRDESNNSATVETDAFTVAVPELTLSEITIEPGDTADPVQSSTLRFTARVSSAVNITVPFSVTFEVDGKPLKTVQLDRATGSNTVLQAGQPVDVFAEWVVADGSHTVTVTADPDRAVVDAPVVQTARTLDLAVRKPDLWLSDVYNAPADTLDYGGEAKFTVRVSNRSTATLFDKYALVLSAARWADNDTEPAESAYEAVSRTQYNGIQGNSTSIQILSFKPEHSGKYSVRVSLEPVGSADFDTTYYQPYTFTYTVRDGMTLTTSPNKNGESNDYGANMFLESQNTIPVKASAKMADGTVLTANDGLTITASILGTDKQVNLVDTKGDGNFSAELPVSGLATQNYTLRFDGVYGGYSATYETQIVFVQDVRGSLSVSDGTTTVQTVDGEEPGLQVAAGTPVTITGTVTQGDGDPYTGTIVLELDLLPGYQQQPDGTVVEGSAEGVITWYRGQKIIFIDPETAEDRADMTYDTETGTFTYTFTPQAKESGKWVVRAYAYDRLMGTDITSTAFTVYGMEPSPSETVVTMTKGSNLDTGSVTLNLHNAAWGGTFGKLTGVTAVLENGSAYPGITVTLDQDGFARDLPVSKDALSIPVSVTTTAGAPDYAEYTVTFSAVSNDGGSGSVNVSAQAVLKLYLRPATAAPKATPANVVVSANPGDTITRTVTVKNNGMGDWTDITIQQPGLSFIRADNLSKTAVGQWESLTFDVTFAPLASTQLGRYQDQVVLTNEKGDVTCTIPVALEVTALDTGTATFQVTSDLGDQVKNAQIKLYGKDPQIQIINGVETEYYLNYSLTTDENGLAVLEGKPAGAYDYVITAQGMETYEGVLELMPGLSGQAEAITLTTLPVQITWTVTETTIVDQYDIKLNIDMGVTIPTPKLGSTTPWFTVPKEVDNPITLTTNIVNNSLVDVYDVSAQIDYTGAGENPGISVVGGGYIGTIPAMSYKTVQIVVQPATYELASRPKAQAALKVTGSYLSYDADGLPEMPAKDLSLSVGIYNPGTSKVTVDTLADGLDLEEKLELSLPEDVDVSELEYLLLWEGELGTEKPERPDGGSVMELVKMELSQTASLERQAFDATLTVTNNYTGNITLQGLTANVVVERVEDDGTVTDATALMYILPQRTAPSILQPGETATLTWKLIPGEGMGGTEGIQYQVRADVGYTVVTPGEGETPGTSKPVQTSTQAVEITVKPQPSLTVDYFLPHKVYPGVPFNLEVVVTNSGYGPAQNVVLDSSQLEIVENKSGLVGTWQIVSTSFGSSSGSSFRVTLGDVGAGATVKGWYTIRWELPTAAGELGDDVYGEVLNFTATLTHRPYEGVELNPLITAVYTHIVGKDEVTLQEEGQEAQTVKVIMGDHGLPAFFWNTETNVRVPLYVPRAVSDGTLEGYTYTFTAPERAETPDTTDARHAVLMIGEVEAMTGIPVSAVYRYDNASMTGTPVTLSHGNYWKDTYKNAEGKDTDYLYIVDELKLENGQVQPRYYKVVYGSGVELKEPETSQILYDENGERTAVLYETGRNHELNDEVPAQISVKAVNNSGNEEQVTVYFYAARYVNGEAQEYTYLGRSETKTLAVDASDTFTYTWELGLTNPDRPTIAGTYRVKMTTLGADLSGEMAASAPGVTADITFNAAPIADAGVDFTVDYGQPAVFDGTRSYDPDGGAIALYVWDFGDGQSGFGPTPSHTYQASGSYIATLYVVDDNGTENVMDKTDWEDGRPTTSQAIHDVMVTVEETRPDLILAPDDGLTITNETADGFSAEDEVTLHAIITNDEAAPVTDNFIATLYVDNVYQGYQRINLYDNGGDGQLAQDETVTVDFTYTMPDSYSHVATVKVNDVSLLVDEADLLNNQRSIVILGSAGRSTFPDLALALSDVTVEGYAPDEKGVVWAAGNGILTLDAGESIAITATVKNEGDLASGATAVILYANGAYAGMAALEALDPDGSQTVTIHFAPEVSGSYNFTLLADGPAAKLVELNKTNNQVEFSLPLAEVLYPDLVITALSATEAEGGYNLTATVENQGDAACPAGLEVAFYAGGRYVGAGKTVNSIAAGGKTQITFNWTQITAAETLTAVVNQGGRILELEQTNNTFTKEEGVSIAAPARPTLKITGVTAGEALTFGQTATASVTVENTGKGNAGAFTVSLYLSGVLVGSGECQGIAAGESATVSVTWTPDQFPTGEMTLTAVADSQYQIVMDSRDGVVMETAVTVGRGVLVTLRDPGTLTRNGQNDLAAEVTDSTYGLYTPGANVTFYLDGQELGTGTYDEATGTYRLNADLSGVELGQKTLRATATMTDEDGACTGEATRTVTLAAPVGITLTASETVLAAGDTLTLSGTTQNVDEGAKVTLILAGCGVYRYTAEVDDRGAYSLTIDLPADLGGTVAASAAVTQNGITRTATQALSVYGAYVSLPGALTLIQGQAQTMTASAVNMGYTDLTNLTLKATDVPAGFTVQFRGTGGVYEIDGETGVSAASLARTENPVSINGAEPEYAALDFGLQIAAAADVEPGDYTLTFTLSGTTGEPNEGKPITRTVGVNVTVREARADLRIDTGDEENPGTVIRAIRPGQTVTALVRAWNAGTGDLTDIQITAPDLPWVNLAIAGLGEDNTLTPYRSSAQRLSIQIVAAPTEKVEAGTYTGAVVLTAMSNGTPVEQNIPVTFHVSAAQIGTAVLELWDEDSVPVPEGAKVSLYGPAEAAEPQLYTAELGEYGRVQLTNYPAGTYTLTFRQSGFEELEQTFVLYPTIDLTPSRVTVERRQFQVTVSTDSFTDLEGVTGDNQAFYDILYQLEVEPTNQAGLAFNYPADEFGASYSLGRVSSRISARNSCLESTGSVDETLHNVAFTLFSDDPDYEGLITFRGENGSVSAIELDELAPGQQLDLVWELAESALYVRAGVAEAEGSANTYTMTLPADCGLVWNGEAGMFPTWNSENGGQYILLSVSGDGLVATVLAKTDAEGVTAPAPDSRVPKVQLVDQDGEFIAGGWYLDFTLAASGERWLDETGESVQPIARTVPLRVSYVSQGYYLATNSAQTALDVRMDAAFPALSGVGYKYFSQGFLSDVQIGSSQVSGSGFSLGFSHTTVYENETQVLQVRFDNPSALNEIENLTFELMVSDLPPEDGLLASGASLQNAAFMVTPSIDGEAVTVNPDGSITVNTVEAGKGVTASFLMTPTLELLDLTILDDFVENGLMTREEAQLAAQWLSSLNGDYYAWLNYSYELDGEIHSGSTPAVQQSARPVAQLASSYSLEAGEGNAWYLNATITNTGSSEAEGVILMTPSLPVVEGVTVQLLAGTWAFAGEAFPSGWENTPYSGELEVGSIPGGATIRASYKLLVLDGTNGNTPIAFLSGDSTAGGDVSTFSLLADNATRAEPTAYEQYRQSLLNMVSQNGVSDANAYQSISITTLSGDAQASPKELEQIIQLLALLNAEPGSENGAWLVEQLQNSNLTSEELKALLESTDTYGMESLYAITEEKYAYALSDYLYAVSSLEHWDEQIAKMDAWAGNVSLGVSALGLGVKLGGAGFNAMTQAYKSGSNLSDIWASTKKALQDEAADYMKDFKLYKTYKEIKKLENLTEFWNYIKKAVAGAGEGVATAYKNAVNLKPYKDLLELVQTVKAGCTAAASAKGVESVVQQAKQLDRLLQPAKVSPPVLVTKNGQKTMDLLGETLVKEYETMAKDCNDSIKAYQQAVQELKDPTLFLSGESRLQDVLTTVHNTARSANRSLIVMEEFTKVGLQKRLANINTSANFTEAQQKAIAEYIQSISRAGAADFKNGSLILEGFEETESVVKTLSASAKTMQEGRDALSTILGTTGMVKDLAKGAYNSCVAIAEGNWGQAILEAESAAAMLGTNGDGLANGINGILMGWAGQLMSQKNAEAAKDSAAGLLTVYQTVSNKVYETLYKGNTPHWPEQEECMTLATTFVEVLQSLQDDEKGPPSWIKLPAGNEEAGYTADLTIQLRTISEANESVTVPKPSSKPDIFDDEMYQTIMDFFTHAYVERLMVATTSGREPSKILMDLDLPADGWVDENVLINALTQTQSLMSLRENAAATLDRGIASTEALLKDDTLNATYPTAAMMAYLDELNAYILAAGDDGRSMSGLSPLPVYQRGSGKQVTGTLINYYELRKALAAQNASLAGIYDTTNDAISYNNVNNWFRAAMVTADSVSTILSFTSAAGFGQTLGNISAGVSLGYDVYAFFWNNSHQKTAKNATGVVQAQMPESMRALTTLLSQQAQVTANTGELFGALAQWSKVDPELPVKVVSFSVSDAEAAPGQSTGAGQLRVAFLNGHSDPVQIHPSVLFVSRQGVLTEMPLDTMVLAAGESSEQTATFRIPASTLMDPGGYIALLTWSVSEGTTATVTRSSGPVTARFWAGEQTLLSSMRGSGARSVILASAACREDQETVLTGTVQVTDGTGEVRFYLAAQDSSGAKLTVTGPEGSALTGDSLTKLSILNEGDYWILTSPAAGTYTVRAVIPAGTSGQASIEALTLTGSGAVLDVHSGDALGMGRDLRGNTTSGTLEVYLAESGYQSGAGAVSFALTDEDGNPWSQPGLTWNFFSNKVGDEEFGSAGAASLEAGGVLAATLLVEPDSDDAGALTDGSSPAFLTVTVEPADGESLQSANSLWTENDDGSITYRRPITILVDRTPPAEPTEVTAQDQGNGTTRITGMAEPGQLVGAVLTTDAGNIGQVEGASILAGLTTADETTGEFSLIVATPASGQSLVPFTASATGTLSLASTTEVEEPAGKTEVTVTAPELVTKTYDGTPAQVSASAGGYPGALEYTWSTADGSVPTDAGSYTLTIRVPESDPRYTSDPVRVSVTIDPAPGTSDPAYREPDGLTAQYGAALGTVALPDGWAWKDDETQSLTLTGVHSATYTPENPNYAPVDVGLTVNVNPPAGKIPVTITGLTVSGKTYDGEPAKYEGTPSVTGGYTGELVYTWKKSDGTALTGAPADAGSYTLTVSVPEDSKYTGSAVLPFTISKAEGTSDPDYSVPGNLTGTAGSALSTVTLPDGWAWQDGTQTLTDTGAYPAIYTPKDPNYAPAEVDLTVSVNAAGKIPVEISGLTVSDKIYDGDPIRYEGTPSVTGGYTGELVYTWRKADGTDLTGAPTDAGSYTLIVSVPEDSAYTGSAVLPFTISKAPAASDPAYQEPAGLTGTVGSALSTVTLPQGWSWNSPDTVLSTEQQSYDAVYTPASDNYESVSKALTVTVTGGGHSGGSRPAVPEGETVTNPDGSTTTTVTKPDGTVTETTTYPDGTTGTAQTDPEGNTTAQVEISREGAAQAEQTGQPVELPLPNLVPGADSGSAPTVEVTLPGDTHTVTVKLPVENAGPGVVAVLVREDGTETVVKQSVATGDGVLLTLEDSATIRIVDNTQTFSDVDGRAWYSEAVAFVTARGIFSGTGGGGFSPDGIMTRGMQARVLHNLEDNPPTGVTNIFPDVPPGIWYADAVHWAAEQGIVTGYDNGLYGPDDSITREQLATILWRYAGSPASTHSLDHFTDAGQISAYARQAMAWANEHGIINGTGDGRLAPQGAAQRSQAAQMLMNFCQYRAK